MEPQSSLKCTVIGWKAMQTCYNKESSGYVLGKTFSQWEQSNAGRQTQRGWGTSILGGAQSSAEQLPWARWSQLVLLGGGAWPANSRRSLQSTLPCDYIPWFYDVVHSQKETIQTKILILPMHRLELWTVGIHRHKITSEMYLGTLINCLCHTTEDWSTPAVAEENDFFFLVWKDVALSI